MPADESVSSSGSNDTPEESNTNGNQVIVYNQHKICLVYHKKYRMLYFMTALYVVHLSWCFCYLFEILKFIFVRFIKLVNRLEKNKQNFKCKLNRFYFKEY